MKPVSVRSITRLTLGTLSMGILVACGGAGGGGLGVADGGIRGTGSSVGPVSGFGSVFVNGVRFDTGTIVNERVQGDDGITHEDDLDEGMILRVEGEWRANGEGTASELEYDDTLRGPITVESAWDPASQSAVISILGLRVNIDRQTVIKGVALPDDLEAGDLVRVSGWRLANEEFRASLVRVQSGSAVSPGIDDGVELEGRIRNYQSAPCSFSLGTVTVGCNDLGLQFDLPLNRADLANDLFVEVEGSLLGAELIAEEIRQDDQRRYRRGTEDDIEFSGPVTEDFDTTTDSFLINGVPVIVTNDTEFEDGLSATDLVGGLLIQVEGDYQPDGITVIADEIELREANAEVEGPIEVGLDRGIFTVGGVRVRITANTLIENNDDDAIVNANKEDLLSQLVAGVEVEVEGIERDNGEILEAVKIEIDDGEDGGTRSFELEGKLRAITENSITVLGVTLYAPVAAFDDVTREQLEGLFQPEQNAFPILEVDYDKVSGFGFSYQAEDIELKEGD